MTKQLKPCAIGLKLESDKLRAIVLSKYFVHHVQNRRAIDSPKIQDPKLEMGNEYGEQI